MHVVCAFRGSQGSRREAGGRCGEGDLAEGGGPHGHVSRNAHSAGRDGRHALLRQTLWNVQRKAKRGEAADIGQVQGVAQVAQSRRDESHRLDVSAIQCL